MVSRKLAGILKHSCHSIASAEGVKAIDRSKTVIGAPKKRVKISEAMPTNRLQECDGNASRYEAPRRFQVNADHSLGVWA